MGPPQHAGPTAARTFLLLSFTFFAACHCQSHNFVTSCGKLGELDGHIFSRLLALSSPKHAQRFTTRYRNIGLTTLLSTTARCGTQHQAQCHHAKRATMVAEIPSILRRLQVRNSPLTLCQDVGHLTLLITGLLGSTSATTRKEAIESKADLFFLMSLSLVPGSRCPTPPPNFNSDLGFVRHDPACSGNLPAHSGGAPAWPGSPPEYLWGPPARPGCPQTHSSVPWACPWSQTPSYLPWRPLALRLLLSLFLCSKMVPSAVSFWFSF